MTNEIEVTNKLLQEQVTSRPSWMPQYAGRAIILKINLDRITRLKEFFDKAEWIPDNTNSVKVFKSRNLKINIIQFSEF